MGLLLEFPPTGPKLEVATQNFAPTGFDLGLKCFCCAVVLQRCSTSAPPPQQKSNKRALPPEARGCFSERRP